MANQIINKYISEAYNRLLDFCKYHCEQQHLYGLEYDLLNCVLTNILSRAEKQEVYNQKLLDMLAIKKDKWTELDFYILRTIKFNAQSDTAPFKRQYDLYKPAGTYTDVDFQRLDVIDDRDENIEKEKDLQEKEARFKDACELYGLSDKARAIFRWKFIEGNSLSEYPYESDRKNLYAIYNGVLQLVKDKLEGRLLF